MKKSGWSFRLAIAAVFAAVVFSAGARADEFTKRFEYDRKKPLKASVRQSAKNAYFVQYHIEYVGGDGARVPALLNLPVKGKGPFPCIVAQHGYGGSKEDMRIVAVPVAKMGYAMFSIDTRLHGERKKPGRDIFSVDMQGNIVEMIQTVVDLRRGVDYLATRGDIAKDRIGYVGVSMGALLGTVFSGVDARVKAPVLVVGGGGWKTLIGESQIGPAQVLRKYLEEKHIKLEDMAKMAEVADPLNYVWRISPRPVLFINGKRDVIVPVSSNKLLQEKAREPKKVVWFEGIEGEPTGHIPPIADVVEMCREWWEEHL